MYRRSYLIGSPVIVNIPLKKEKTKTKRKPAVRTRSKLPSVPASGRTLLWIAGTRMNTQR